MDTPAAPAPVVKPGYRTTEFWLATAAALVGILVASGAIQSGSVWDKALGLVAAALASIGYSVSRGSAKRG